jgi:hypothetical protein
MSGLKTCGCRKKPKTIVTFQIRADGARKRVFSRLLEYVRIMFNNVVLEKILSYQQLKVLNEVNYLLSPFQFFFP